VNAFNRAAFVIANICLSNRSNAAEKIGYLKLCEATQKQEYAKLAKHPDCFGDDISKWNPAQIKLMGTQLGKCNTSMFIINNLDSEDPSLTHDIIRCQLPHTY
jgi:predicted NAD-dependent protein-ADP-ribosyltransferase YbiA (DUF1768 family)